MKDPFLMTLVNLAHTQGLSFGITLTTPGGVITGTLISTGEFFNSFADSFAGAWTHGSSEELREGLAAWGEHRGGELKAGDGGEDPFIHLKNVRHLDGNGSVPSSGTGFLWRGKIEDITGFALGTL